ncbi:hypothetical protein A2818_00830 [Candidatus Nomurabacteria bacterium RIFCSPHIGHO2_01_FULL_40_12]|uniref:Type 4 fimbrial biogenesis protein PilX N-terminal domain-containing protein n=1 Tax=Candidatus Nomurabacteria bacterium RIFCSPHIGHO2_01_FULL_40_12 TaxID=1801737 RepID=A0A1F6UZF1_9BACT|nr:MAG: hypothetical protein A2818_00830 [Candidatus Nomurabacteria bacterium RIFCSPHIGHO2_01_FULL_40_12]
MKKIKTNGGAAMLISVVFFLFISLSIISGLVSPTVREFKNASVNLNSKKSYFLAESGSEDALYRLINGIAISENPDSEIITLDSNSVTTTITTNGSSKQITSLGDVKSYQRKTSISLTTGVGTSFNYGVQVGQGGLEMSNTSKIVGNVYSGGEIEGENSASITGTAVVSGTSGKIETIQVDGDATAHFIEGSTIGGSTNSYDLKTTRVTGNVVATTITSCTGTVGGNATFDTKASCTIAGTQTTPNPVDFVDPEVTPLPITDEQVLAWENDAAIWGTINSQTYDSGTTNLGPKKINGDLTVKNTATLNVTGTLWVTGKVTFENSAIVRLDSGYGSASGVIVAGVSGSTTAGLITLKNSAQIQGSGTAGSYIMLLSQMVNTASTSIDAGNTGSAAILYAGYGLIDINNSGAFKEITAAKLKISNSATITYESGLANVNFSSGPSGGYSIESWKETE